MKKINLWETKLASSYTYFKTFEDYINYLKENNKEMSFIVKESFNPEIDKPEGILDNVAIRDLVKLTYVDKEHPIAFSDDYIKCISKEFFEKNKEKFIEYAKKEFMNAINNKETWIQIPDFIFNEEILNIIIKEKNTTFYLKQTTNKPIELSKEIRDKIIINHINFTLSNRNQPNEEISSKYAFSYYTFEDLEKTTSISLTIPLEEKTIENLIYTREDSTIVIDNNPKNKNDEKTFFDHLIEIFNKLSNKNRKFNIKIEVINRELLRQSKLVDNIPNNINLIINHGLYDYNMDLYQKEEEKLEKLIKPIRDSNLSPLEKYISAYNIAKNFKPYKENKEDPSQARYLIYILNEENEYIVCVGFTELLKELLTRIGIANMKISAKVDISYDKGYTQEEKAIEYVGHARNLIKIDDDKYNVHGYYIADSTWDNDLNNDYYQNALITFDKRKEAKRLEKLEDYDIFLDFHNQEEFNEKIEYFLKSRISRKRQQIKKELSIDQYISVFQDIYNEIMRLLKELDNEKYDYFYNKYNKECTSYNITIDKIKNIIAELLKEYSYYIMPLVNKEVNIDTIIKAAKESKKVLENISEEELNSWEEKTKYLNERISEKVFPYIYNPEEKKEAHLEDRKGNTR